MHKHNKKLVFSSHIGRILSPDFVHEQGFYFIFQEKHTQKMCVGTAGYTHIHIHTNTFNGWAPQWCSHNNWGHTHTHTNSYLEPHSWDHTGRHTDTGVCFHSLCQFCRVEDTSSSSPLPEVSPDTTLLWNHTHTLSHHRSNCSFVCFSFIHGPL